MEAALRRTEVDQLAFPGNDGVHFGMKMIAMKEQALPEFGGKSPRQMMQTLGAEWGRNMIDTNPWITVARKRLERYVEAS